MTNTTNNRFFHLTPGTPAAARLAESEHYYLAGNFNESLAATQQAWREHPREPDVFRVLAYLHMARGEYPPAAQAAYQAVALDGNNPASLATLAQVYVTFNNLTLAEEALGLAMSRFPGDTMLLTLSADVHFRRGRTALGVQLAQRALSQNPEDAYARALLGTHFLRKRDYNAAAHMLATAVAAYPHRWDYLRDYGIALLHTGVYPAARDLLTQSFRLRPDDHLTRHGLYYAINITANRNAWYWIINLFFQRYRGFGGCMQFLGVMMGLAGPCWLIYNLLSNSADLLGIITPIILMLLGVLFVILTQGANMMAGRGKRAEQFLQRITGVE